MVLQEKVVLITGGGSGIGAALARAFAHEGARVVICGRRAVLLEATREQIAALGGEALAVPADLTHAAEVNGLVDRVRERYGRLDVLVNNAGILGVRAPIAQYPTVEWDEVLAANLTAVFRLTQAALPLIPHGGSIVNVSSSVGRVGRAGWGAYAVSKFGIEGFSQVLADELRARGIRVNTVNPGGTRTAMRATAYPGEDPATVPSPDEVTPIVVYLASDQSIGVTGQALNARNWGPETARTRSNPGLRAPAQLESCACRRVADTMSRLRAPDGCPWDRDQTHQSLVPYLIEETYETVDAIAAGSPSALKEELGDLILQIAFHAQLAAEAGAFTFDDVLQACAEKLIRRHPHVFDPRADRAHSAKDVVGQWDAIKQREGKPARGPSLEDGVPKSLPALARAQQVQTRAARVGFDWDKADDVLAKLDEEFVELREAVSGGDQARTAAELGDVLFTVVNLARRLNLDPESSLRASITRFASRFAVMEGAAGRPLSELDLAEMNQLWEHAKRITKG
jgi:tetrapyrrole methylase family protein/MazG family protein